MVIQRIQSVYLLLVTILMAIYSFSDVVLVKTIAESFEKIRLYDLSLVAFILSLLVTLLSFVTILKFKSMKLQIALCSVNIMLVLTQLVVMVVDALGLTTVQFDQFLLSNSLPLLSVVFLVLSISSIKRDMKLLSSYDRLR
ncbi:MAG: DUF4293 family protein [Muribaculaceae bacterium]|jgi:hypothetical protein|nr:DUF4293 family protein [Muribaculaceae bacterium]MEE1337360.1 DUF4293 family protein [Muribaculaceae bacterium]